MWCRAVCYMDTQEASSSILRMEDGGSMSRRNAGASCPGYTEAHPVILTLSSHSSHCHHTFFGKMCKQILLVCVGGSLSLVLNRRLSPKRHKHSRYFQSRMHDFSKTLIFYIFGLSYTWCFRVTSSNKGEVILDPESWNTVVSIAFSITCARDRCVSLL